MAPMQEAELEGLKVEVANLKYRVNSMEDKIGSIYEKFERYLPRWVTFAGASMGMMLGSAVTVIAVMASGGRP